MTVSELILELQKCEDQSISVMMRAQNYDGDEQLIADDISISVSAGCGEVEFCIIDGVQPDLSEVAE